MTQTVGPMDFVNAMRALLDGAKVRRGWWPAGEYLACTEPSQNGSREVMRYSEEKGTTYGLDEHRYGIEGADILAEDWEMLTVSPSDEASD